MYLFYASSLCLPFLPWTSFFSCIALLFTHCYGDCRVRNLDNLKAHILFSLPQISIPISHSDISNVFHIPTSSYSILRCFWCFLMFSYSTLQHFRCFPHSSDIFLHSNIFPTPMFPISSCSIPFQVHAPMYSDVFPTFIDAEPFWSHYGLIIIMEPFGNIKNHFPTTSQSRKHHGLFIYI